MSNEDGALQQKIKLSRTLNAFLTYFYLECKQVRSFN